MIESLEEISQSIGNLEKHHHIEILKMIKRDQQNVTISENTNGCFINMNDLNDDLLEKIKTYVIYNIHQEIELDKHEDIKNTIIKDLK
tara:strand:- start:29 stop:292 length:264 start_codon:yes stop_codon:yes gene_type:complete